MLLRKQPDQFHWFRAYQYPGKDVVERAISLYSDLLKIRDVSEFFKAVTEKKDEINSREDIDRYVEELKAKLLKEFDKNNNLTIR